MNVRFGFSCRSLCLVCGRVCSLSCWCETSVVVVVTVCASLHFSFRGVGNGLDLPRNFLDDFTDELSALAEVTAHARHPRLGLARCDFLYPPFSSAQYSLLTAIVILPSAHASTTILGAFGMRRT